MTVGTATPYVEYVYSGPDDYAFAFLIFAEEELEVVHTTAAGVSTVLVLTTNYTVTFTEGVAGGTVTTTYAPTTGTLEIRRKMTIDQLVDWVNNDPFDMDILERAIDKLTMVAQQMNLELGKTIRLPLSWVGDAPVLPDLEASHAIIVNSAGTGFEYLDIAAFANAEANAAAALDSANAAAGSAALADGSADDAADSATYAEEWAIAAEDAPVSVAAGGDGSTTFSALHWAAKALAAASGLLGDLGTAFNSATAKTTPHDDDVFGYADSEDTWTLKKLTWANIRTAIEPAGTVKAYAGAVAPTGYLLANGAAVSRTTYADLFTAIGVVYGVGDGSTTFNLPDLRGRSVFGDDTMGASAASRLTSGTVADSGGAETHTLTEAEMPIHNHTASTNTTGSHTHSYNDEGNTSGGSDQASGTGRQDIDSGRTTGSAGNHSHTVTVNNAGSGNAHNNMPPYLVMNWIIKT